MKNSVLPLGEPGVYQYPSPDRWLRSLKLCPPEKMKVAFFILYPYKIPGMATGVALSVPPHYQDKEMPYHIRTLIRLYEKDLGYPRPKRGCLEQWAESGVLLYNWYPVVSSKDMSDERFHCAKWSDRLITEIMIHIKYQMKNKVLVFVGGTRKYAKFMQEYNPGNHEIIEIDSFGIPRSAVYRALHRSKLFSKINKALEDRGEEPIDWKLRR